MKGIYLITDQFSLLEQVIDCGLGAVQFRGKGIFEIEEVKKMYLLCQKKGIPFIVNDRVDLALLLGADGVHLGQNDFPLKQARALLGPSKILGATAGTLAEALQGASEGADYIGFGHLYPTSTKKKTGDPVGIERLKEVCEHLSVPIFAIGGIRLGHLEEIKEVGARGVAVCSAISQALSPKKMALEMVEKWNGMHSRFN